MTPGQEARAGGVRGLRSPNLSSAHASHDQLTERGIQTLRSYSAEAKPLISIIIPAYNTAQWIGDAVRSALNQTLREIEVVVIDDGSTDEGLAIISQFSDDRITILTQPNQGLSAARNSGILVARAELIGFLDGDDVWFPSKADEHFRVHKASADIGLTFSWSVYIDSSGRETGQFLISRCGNPDARELTHWNHVGNGSTPVVRRSCFEQAGLFDENLRSCEDLDMWVRIAACTPFKLSLIPKLLTGYRVREGSLSLTFDTFMNAAEQLKQRFSNEIPGFDSADGRRVFAQMARIASRKALADRQVLLSRKLLLRAIAVSPKIVMTDVRAIALIAIHAGTFWLPERIAYAAYKYVASAVGGFVPRAIHPKAVTSNDVH